MGGLSASSIDESSPLSGLYRRRGGDSIFRRASQGGKPFPPVETPDDRRAKAGDFEVFIPTVDKL